MHVPVDRVCLHAYACTVYMCRHLFFVEICMSIHACVCVSVDVLTHIQGASVYVLVSVFVSYCDT